MATILDALLALGFTATQVGDEPVSAIEYSQRVTVHSDTRPSWGVVVAKRDELAPRATIDSFRLAIQAHIDATAGERSYDSGLTCASYVNSTNPTWAAESSAFVAWRDAVWVYAYAELAKVESGQRPQPTVETILAELPALTWPV